MADYVAEISFDLGITERIILPQTLPYNKHNVTYKIEANCIHKYV